MFSSSLPSISFSISNLAISSTYSLRLLAKYLSKSPPGANTSAWMLSLISTPTGSGLGKADKSALTLSSFPEVIDIITDPLRLGGTLISVLPETSVSVTTGEPEISIVSSAVGMILSSLPPFFKSEIPGILL